MESKIDKDKNRPDKTFYQIKSSFFSEKISFLFFFSKIKIIVFAGADQFLSKVGAAAIPSRCSSILLFVEPTLLQLFGARSRQLCGRLNPILPENEIARRNSVFELRGQTRQRRIFEQF